MARPYHQKRAAYQWLHSAGRHSQACRFSTNTCQSNRRRLCTEIVPTPPHSSGCTRECSALPICSIILEDSKRSRRRKKCHRRSDDCCKPSKCQTACRSKCDRYKWALENNRKHQIWSCEEVSERASRARRRRRSSSRSRSRLRSRSRSRPKRSTQCNLPYSSCKTIPLKINSDTNLYISVQNSYAKRPVEKRKSSQCGSPQIVSAIPSYYDRNREERRRSCRNMSGNRVYGSIYNQRRNAISGSGFQQSWQQQSFPSEFMGTYDQPCAMMDPLSSQMSRSISRMVASRGQSRHKRRGSECLRAAQSGALSVRNPRSSGDLRAATSGPLSVRNPRSSGGLRAAPSGSLSVRNPRSSGGLRAAPSGALSARNPRSSGDLRAAPSGALSVRNPRSSGDLRAAPSGPFSARNPRSSGDLRAAPSGPFSARNPRSSGDLRAAPSGPFSARNPPPVIYSMHPQQERGRSSKPLPVAPSKSRNRDPTPWMSKSRASSDDSLEDGSIFDMPDFFPPPRS